MPIDIVSDVLGCVTKEFVPRHCMLIQSVSFHSLVVSKLRIVLLYFLSVIPPFLCLSSLYQLIQVFYEYVCTLKRFAKVVCSLMILRILVLNVRNVIIANPQGLLVLRLLEDA